MFSYSDVALKLILGFLTIVIQINLAGKGNLAPTNALDQLQNYVLGGVIGGMIYNQDITLLQFFAVLLIWTLIIFVTRFLTNHYTIMKKFIDGQSVTVVYNGRILVEQAASRGLSAYDLSFKLRNAGVIDIHQVKRAVLEQNGQVTVTLKGDKGFQYPIILDGRIDFDALDLIDKDEAWLNDQLQAQNETIEDVYMAIWTKEGLLLYAYGHGAHKP
ncbi:hypothetical protein FC83_GL001934 [Agrilactobacillus composti DSM 18527 = JCM 14202]|uniref:Membrane protein yetF n=1 Tax=Agrilactobacillus composti DSM 18527 = JCM 14202 TaxID=1423734 RepID=A0A0R1XYI4_9LACO|nr:DUF421 domain-containing protein [Agrilactobacillus composti]KRM34797.1 hypothetical protein FC83_GL001934 [Agrilactobacillus composti DSM 18527 = JCM 14202]